MHTLLDQELSASSMSYSLCCGDIVVLEVPESGLAVLLLHGSFLLPEVLMLQVHRVSHIAVVDRCAVFHTGAQVRHCRG